MPHLIIMPKAAKNMEKCRLFLCEKSLEIARRSDKAIRDALLLLKTSPEMGRPYKKNPMLRELIIKFGSSGYLALYIYDPAKDTIYIVAFKHARGKTYQ